jgi:protoporphyrinogen oxidase
LISKNKKIAIIGAGPMGLAAACQLVKLGYTPDIYEADDRVGGMTASFNFSGTQIERFYHFHCTSDKDLFEMLADLRLESKLRWTKTKMGFWYDNKLQAWGNPIALIRFKGLGIISKIRYGAHIFLSTKKKTWTDLDNKTAVKWIKSTIGIEAYNVLWKKLFDLKFYHFANKISAAWIWSRIFRIGNSRFNVFFEKLGYLEGGSQILLDGLSRRITKGGGRIYLKSKITEIVVKKGSVKGILLDDIFINYDLVFSTIPTPFVSKIIPALPKKIKSMYESIENIAVVCVILKLSKKITNNFWLNINDDNMDIPGVIEYSNLNQSKNHIVYIPFYMPQQHYKFAHSNKTFIDKSKKYIMKINPSITEGDFLDSTANRYLFAQPICMPKHLERLPPIATVINGLYIADTSYYYPNDRGISESVGLGKKIATEICFKNI